MVRDAVIGELPSLLELYRNPVSFVFEVGCLPFSAQEGSVLLVVLPYCLRNASDFWEIAQEFKLRCVHQWS